MSIVSDKRKVIELLSEKKYIVFDFDGVIADSVEVKTDAFAEMYMKYGMEIVEKVVAHHRSNGGMSRFEKFKYYHNKFLNIDLSENDIKNLSNQFSKLVVDKVVDAKEIEGVNDFIKYYCGQGKDCHINTATPTEEIITILRRRKLKSYFISVMGSPETKNDNARKIIESSNYSPDDGVFIGDAHSDFVAAELNGLEFIGVGDTIKSILSDIKGDWIVLNNFKECIDDS